MSLDSLIVNAAILPATNFYLLSKVASEAKELSRNRLKNFTRSISLVILDSAFAIIDLNLFY